MSGIPIASGLVSVTANSTSSNQVQNTYDYVGVGRLTLFAKSSATGVQANLFVSGNQVCNRLLIPFTGTAGTMDTSANMVAAGNTLGGRVELTFTNTTGGTLTADYLLTFLGIPIAGNAISRLLGR